MNDKIELIDKTNLPIKKNNLPYFDGKENYWVISSGREKDLYDYFHKNNIIGLAWDKIDVEHIKNKTMEEIKEVVRTKYANLEKKYEEDSGFSRAVTIFSKEINFFVNEIKLGDIVVVKDKRKNRLMFGKIISEAFEDLNHTSYLKIDEDRGNCNKLRKIKWLNIKEIDNVSELIKNTIQNQQAIVKINEEKTISEINKTIFSLFYRENKIHAIFNIKKNTDIEFEKYYEFLKLIHEIEKDNKFTERLYIKTNVSSPGPIEIFGNATDVQQLLSCLGVFSFIGVTAVSKYTEKYKITKEELEIENPGENDGFTRGN